MFEMILTVRGLSRDFRRFICSDLFHDVLRSQGRGDGVLGLLGRQCLKCIQISVIMNRF